jgi:hypothetical protein
MKKTITKIYNKISNAFYGRTLFNICLLGLLVCNIAIGRCLPGFNYEPKFPDEILK